MHQALSGGRTKFIDRPADHVVIALLADIPARSPYDARASGHLAGAKPTKQPWQYFSSCQITRATKDDKIERLNGNDTGDHGRIL
jgi:hypothetical protein